MNWSSNLQIPKALPCSSPPYEPNNRCFSISCSQKEPHNSSKSRSQVYVKSNVLHFAGQISGILATIAEPALAVTGENDEIDLTWTLIQMGISAFFYFILCPPIIMNWLRTRWYKRGLIEMYFQFMFVFIFFPGMLLWAPFVNIRKFPRDPTKYPWSTPANPSEIKGGFLKYPWAQPEDYE